MIPQDVGRHSGLCEMQACIHSWEIVSPEPLNNNAWHHLVGVRDQEKKKASFYNVDGELVAEVEDQSWDINSGPILIGEHIYRFYKGIIDEVKIWNRPLSEDEILSLMSSNTTQ